MIVMLLFCGYAFLKIFVSRVTDGLYLSNLDSQLIICNYLNADRVWVITAITIFFVS